MKINHNISLYFDTLKVLSIFTVFFGHFFYEIPLMWIPVTVGLIIFSFSSGYFTSLKYNNNFVLSAFWYNKLIRLGFKLLTINIFLLVLFFIQDKQDILSWKSLVNMLGLNGFLNWFRIENTSPFGRGVWFFTLLLIFYAAYPLIEYLIKTLSTFFVIPFVSLAFYLHTKVNYGHGLWITSCGFIFGVYFANKEISVKPKSIRMITLLVLIIFLLLNLATKFRLLNFFFILSLSILFIYSWQDQEPKENLLKPLLIFSPCLLEIYLIHSYLIIQLSGNRILDFILSLSVTLTAALLLQRLSQSLVRVKLK